MPGISATSQRAESRWTSREELYMFYGRTNIQRWADIENSQNDGEINKKISWAVDTATVEARSRLYGSPAGTIATAPENLRLAVTKFAGVLLYESRGLKDETEDKDGKSRLTQHKKDFMNFIRAVHAGVIVLQGMTPVTTTPFVGDDKLPHITSNGAMLTPDETRQRNDYVEKQGNWGGAPKLWESGFDA